MISARSTFSTCGKSCHVSLNWKEQLQATNFVYFMCKSSVTGTEEADVH